MTDSNEFPKINPGTSIGPFVIEKVLSSEGNMSRLFVARNEKGRLVALKIARSDNQLYTNFLQDEVAQLTKTRHPNVIHLYPIQLAPRQKVYIARAVALSQIFNGNTPWYYAMEMIGGGSMHDHRNDLPRFPLEWRIEFLYQVGLGIKYLHDKGLAHRDIKPDNIIFRERPQPNQRPQPVLVDFGIASRHNENLRVTAATLRYAAPEVAEKLEKIRASYRTTLSPSPNHMAADIWAFGVLCYEIMTGHHPFEPYRTNEEIAEKILHSPPGPMDGISEDIQRIIVGDPHQRDPFGGLRWGMLSKVREDRPQIDDVLEHLDTGTPYLPPRY